MSRGRSVELEHEHARREAGGGRDMPRGGRSGGHSRPQTRPAKDVRDVLAQQLDLPRGDARERVSVHDRSYELRGSEVRTLAAVGAFRVVDANDVPSSASRDRWHGDLERLRAAKLIELRPHVLAGRRTTLITLTADGQRLLERHRRPQTDEPRQEFYSGMAKPRELTHDAQLYRAYATAAGRLQDSGARVRRVVVDYELKRDYQRFLQANNRAHRRSSGRPDRSADEIRAWAAANDLTIVRDRVRFPDVRIEYERPDGSRGHEDLELATGHYNSRQMAGKRAAGFTMHRSDAGRLRGGKAHRGASPFDPHAAEQVLR